MRTLLGEQAHYKPKLAPIHPMIKEICIAVYTHIATFAYCMHPNWPCCYHQTLANRFTIRHVWIKVAGSPHEPWTMNHVWIKVAGSPHEQVRWPQLLEALIDWAQSHGNRCQIRRAAVLLVGWGRRLLYNKQPWLARMTICFRRKASTVHQQSSPTTEPDITAGGIHLQCYSGTELLLYH